MLVPLRRPLRQPISVPKPRRKDHRRSPAQLTQMSALPSFNSAAPPTEPPLYTCKPAASNFFGRPNILCSIQPGSDASLLYRQK